MLRHKVSTKPTIYPIDATDTVLKQHLRLSSSDTSEDDLLTEYIKASTEEIERYIGYPLMTQVIEVLVGDTPKTRQELTGNVVSAVSYSYYVNDTYTNVEDVTGISLESYGLLTYMVKSSWTSGTRYKIVCNAGYTVSNVPDDIKQACRYLVMSKYENREGNIPMPETVMEILDRHLLY